MSKTDNGLIHIIGHRKCDINSLEYTDFAQEWVCQLQC